MQLVSNIEIANFRSIKALDAELGRLTAFVGTNGSGKSNVFRALNLFFNGVLEPDDGLQMSRDYHKPWQKTGNRDIDVTLTFALPAAFHINKPLRDSLEAIGIVENASFAVRKRWEPDPLRVGEVTESVFIKLSGAAWGSALGPDSARAANRFLQLIRFRYVPNHVHPSELLRSESGALRRSLITRSRQSHPAQTAANFDAVLSQIAEAATILVAPIDALLTRVPSHVEGIEIATPSDWADMAWSLALRLQAKDVRPLDVTLHGSGNQTFLMYLLVHFVDTQFGQQFGWHQATIWAIEEPESFLHYDLENSLALFLAESCTHERFQALLTTHRLLFAAAADASYEVELIAGEANVARRDVLELAERTLATGVTGYAHPLTLTQPKPTLIVDGPFDVFYIEEAYRRSGRLNPWDIRCLETIDPSAQGSGKERLKRFLASSAGAVRARPYTSPIVVLLDWEDTQGDEEGFSALVSPHPASRAVRWPVDFANPQAGTSFRGIERYLSTALLEDLAISYPDGGVTRTVADPPVYQVQPDKRSAVKTTLSERCRDRDLVDDLQFIIDALDWLETQIPGLASQASLPAM